MRVTMMDVAKEAGVSKSTVSLVINGSNEVKLETQYLVREAIERLGYVPNLAARGLSTRQTQTLGMVFLTSNTSKRPYVFDSVSETLLYDASNGIYAGLRNSSYALLTERFSSSSNLDGLPGIIKDGRVDGVFLIGGLFTADFIERIKQTHLPIVIIGRKFDGTDSVFSDMETAGYLAAKELLCKNHKRVLFINGPESSLNSRKKLDGIEKAWAEFATENSTLRVAYSAYTGADGYAVIKQLWQDGYRPDAVFGASDGITGGVMRFLYEKRIVIPDDVSIIGYESSILSEYAPVPLTVIDTHKEKMGEEACRALLNRIERERSSPVALSIEPTLIYGSSVAVR